MIVVPKIEKLDLNTEEGRTGVMLGERLLRKSHGYHSLRYHSLRFHNDLNGRE